MISHLKINHEPRFTKKSSREVLFTSTRFFLALANSWKAVSKNGQRFLTMILALLGDSNTETRSLKIWLLTVYACVSVFIFGMNGLVLVAMYQCIFSLMLGMFGQKNTAQTASVAESMAATQSI
ncbi:MAG: hypothetical protein AAF570_21970 [Bacteroidota bacterium]